MIISSSNYQMFKPYAYAGTFQAWVSNPKYSISNFRIGKLPKQIKCHKFSVGKSKQYYILIHELVDPNYL